MPYTVTINTAGALARFPGKRKKWERQLIDDYISAINGTQYICADKDKLADRIEYFAGSGNLPWQDEGNQIKLNNPRYSEQILPLRAYGFAMGYVDVEKLISITDSKNSIRLPFADFYDTRQTNYRKCFKGCYIEINKYNSSYSA